MKFKKENVKGSVGDRGRIMLWVGNKLVKQIPPYFTADLILENLIERKKDGKKNKN